MALARCPWLEEGKKGWGVLSKVPGREEGWGLLDIEWPKGGIFYSHDFGMLGWVEGGLFEQGAFDWRAPLLPLSPTKGTLLSVASSPGSKLGVGGKESLVSIAYACYT